MHLFEILSFAYKNGFITVNLIYPHGKQLIGQGKHFIDFSNNVFFQQFFTAACTELADVRLCRFINDPDVIRSASPSLAIA